MRKLRYGCAVVSFCDDLTSATARSVPIAGLLVGEVGDEAVAAVAWFDLPDGVFGEDRLAAAVMRDLPSLLKAQVDETWSSMDGSIAPMRVLDRLHDLMRTTLHVSHISDSVEQDVAEVEEVPGILVNVICRHLTDVFKGAGVGSPTRTNGTDAVAPSSGAKASLEVQMRSRTLTRPAAEYWPVRKMPRTAKTDVCYASAE